MPHLDFREALSTPEEKMFSPAVSVAAVASNVAAIPSMTDFLRGLRLSRVTWANIVFVAIASIGGMVCAFYFFNGVEVLRAAASWPAEYLYPRPVFEERIFAAELPTPVDRFDATADEPESSKTDDAKSVAQTNSAPTELAPINSTIGTTTPPTPPVITEPPPVIFPPPPTSVVDQLMNTVNPIVNGAGPLIQSFVQDPVGTTSATLATTTTVQKTTKKTAASSRRKLSRSQQTVTTSTSSSGTSLQQTTDQTQTAMSASRPINQMMTGGGLGGGGSIGAIGGGGMGAAGGAGAGTVGGAAGGLGGLNSGGLGGTISGVGGTVGGVIGKH